MGNFWKQVDVLQIMIQPGKISKLLLFFLILSLLVFVAVPSTHAQNDAPGITLTAAAGFDGFYKTGSWVPVQVTVGNEGPAVDGELRMTIGSFASGNELVYKAPISLPTQSNKQVTLYVDIPQILGMLTVQLLDDNGRIVATVDTNTLSQLPPETILYGIVSPDPGELEFLEDVKGSHGRAAVAFLNIASLPEVTPIWNSLDVLVFNDTDTGKLSTKQKESLQQWVRTGGQLVITGGPGWQKTTAGLDEMLPVTISGSDSIADLPALSAHTGVPFRDPGPYLIATSSLRSGELVYHQDGLPLLARQGWGQGQVYFLALDPKLAPLLDWDGNEQVWGTIVNTIPERPYWAQGVQNSYSAGTAVSSLPSIALPSTIILVLFLFFYILVIGPGNYFILNRLNRRELAWATIPALVIIFSAIAYLTGFQLKGNDVILNQMSIVSGSVDGEPVRVQSLVGLYSPRRNTYNIVFPADTLARPFDRNSGSLNGSGSIDAITESSELTMTKVRVDVSAVETFVAQSYQIGPDVTGQASLEIDGSDIILNASIQNNSDIVLENATLLLGSRAFPVQDILPGSTATISTKVGVSSSSSSGTITPYGTVIIPPSVSGAPLTNNAETILGTSNYYEDRAVFPRWQLLDAIDSSYYGSARINTLPGTIVTLVAWSEIPQIDVHLDQDTFKTTATTLYLLQIPLQQNIVGGNEISLPLSLLNWDLLDADNVYDANVENLYLADGSVEFEYTPWLEFQEMEVTSLAVALTTEDQSLKQSMPMVKLWDWAEETWIPVADANWGETKVSDYGRFLGPKNAVRIQLRSDDIYGITIQQIYPILTGNLESES